MKSYIKHISILLAIMMVFSSLTMLSASATTLGEDSSELDDIWVVGGDGARSVLDGFIINHSWDDESWFREQFTDESFAAYGEEYHKAQKVCYDENSTEEQIKSAYDSLIKSYYALEYVTSNEQLRENLKAHINEIRRNMPVGGTPYTKESYKRFSDAMKNAEEIAYDNTSKRSSIIGSGNLLDYYFKKLEYSTADRTKLWAAIEKLRAVIETQGAENLSNYNELKEIYNNVLPVYYYEPEQSVIDEWERKIYIALGTQSGTELTDPTSESVIDYTEPVSSDENPTGATDSSASTEDPTGNCTDQQDTFRMEFASELSRYSFEIGFNEPYPIDEITVFWDAHTMYVFGLSDMLCTVGGEDIEGYHFENPVWNGIEKNKSGYCVYDGSKIYSIKDAVENKIVNVEFLASVIPHTKLVSSVRADLREFLTIHSWDLDWYVEEMYTPESFMIYKGAFIEANKVCYDMSISDEQLQAAYDKVVAAYNALVRIPDDLNPVDNTHPSDVTEPSSTDVTEDVDNSLKEPENITVIDVSKNPVSVSSKKANPIKVKAKTVNAKSKKKTVITRTNAFSISKAKGTVVFQKLSGNNKIVINKTTGMITVKKGLKKGTYRLKVKVTAKGTNKYMSGSKTVAVKIKVK